MKWFTKKTEAEVIDNAVMEVVDGDQQVPETEEKKSDDKKVGKIVGAVAVGAGALALAAFSIFKGKKSDDGYTDVAGPYDPEAADAAPVADEEDFSEAD